MLSTKNFRYNHFQTLMTLGKIQICSGQLTERFLTHASKVLMKHFISNCNGKGKVIEVDSSEENMNQKIDSILEISDEPESLGDLLSDVECLMDSCLKIGGVL